MKRLLAQMRKDLVECAPWFIGWLVAATALAIVLSIPGSDAQAGSPFGTAVMSVISLWPPLVVVAVFLRDPAYGSESHWKALPIRPITLVTAKFLLCLITVATPLAIVQWTFSGSLNHGMTAATTPWQVAFLLLGSLGSIGTGALAGGTFARTFPQAFLFLLILVLGGPWLSWVSLDRSYANGQIDVETAYFHAVVYGLAGLAASFLVVLVSYRWSSRKVVGLTWLAWKILVLAVFAESPGRSLAALAPSHSWPPLEADAIAVEADDDPCGFPTRRVQPDLPHWRLAVDIDLPVDVDGFELIDFRSFGKLDGINVRCATWDRVPKENSSAESEISSHQIFRNNLVVLPESLEQAIGHASEESVSLPARLYLYCYPPPDEWDRSELEYQIGRSYWTDAEESGRPIPDTAWIHLESGIRFLRLGETEVVPLDRSSSPPISTQAGSVKWVEAQAARPKLLIEPAPEILRLREVSNEAGEGRPLFVFRDRRAATVARLRPEVFNDDPPDSRRSLAPTTNWLHLVEFAPDRLTQENRSDFEGLDLVIIRRHFESKRTASGGHSILRPERLVLFHRPISTDPADLETLAPSIADHDVRTQAMTCSEFGETGTETTLRNSGLGGDR